MISAEGLRDGMAEQGRVIHALLLREISIRFGQRRLGYAWAFFEPAMHILVLISIKEVLGNLNATTIPLPLLLVTGIVPFMLFRTAVSRTISAARGSRDVLMIAQVTVMDVIWARALLELATSIVVLVGMLLVCAALGWAEPVQDPLRVFSVLLLMWLLGIGLGLVIAVGAAYFPIVQQIWTQGQRFLYLSSGVFFSVTRLPEKLLPYMLWNPLLHALETMRDAYFVRYNAPPFAIEIGYAWACAVALLLAGLVLIRKHLRAVLDA